MIDASFHLALFHLPAAPTLDDDAAAVADTCADIAEATYGDSPTTAKALQTAVAALVAAPSAETLTTTRIAWLAARVPCQQSEAFRFGNSVVDDWEGKVSGWPLDEGLSYVDPGQVPSDENPLAILNVIATPKLTLSGTESDPTTMTFTFISGTLQDADGIESNVAAGYHAVEFLLSGQFLNGTAPGAGNRPHNDFVVGNACTAGQLRLPRGQSGGGE